MQYTRLLRHLHSQQQLKGFSRTTLHFLNNLESYDQSYNKLKLPLSLLVTIDLLSDNVGLYEDSHLVQSYQH